MDFPEYKARIVGFHRILMFLWMIQENNYPLSDLQKKRLVQEFVPLLRQWCSSPQESDYLPHVELSVATYLEIYRTNNDPDTALEDTPFVPDNLSTLTPGVLKSLKHVDLMGDIDTLTRQAEVVKQEIIAHGKVMRVLFDYSNELNGEKPPLLSLVKDFIRDKNGKILYPFEYWRDCVEVWMKKFFHNHSNERIAKEFNFSTSSSGTLRARQKLVSDMLSEVNDLIDLLKSNKFPPKILSGTKQPSVKG
ncbi:hypothetical protein GEOBRER4_n1649 [Citrifermentans bremense]|uniref:Uncharacterized protein n=1 Tax=Citrifermentans bremense TaxID=60035 RepID=A0A6S6M4H0_9BACT|nr:hypothetical protein [Citrifermentans bremense]BCG46836.1 hypothetical protein GEOBRER4_n1649 [Citrifermentans bremense]